MTNKEIWDKLIKLREEEETLISAVIDNTKKVNTINFELEDKKKKYEKEIDELIHKRFDYKNIINDQEKNITTIRDKIEDLEKQLGVKYE